jgi:pimeloyl-ACP methyl ester carboxylesterase
VIERWFSPEFSSSHAAEVAGWRNMLLHTPVAGYIGTCQALRDADLTQAAQSIHVPTLCLCGEKDGATPPDLVRSLSELIPGSAFELIQGAGHLPGIEAPDQVSELILNFIGRAQ